MIGNMYAIDEILKARNPRELFGEDKSSARKLYLKLLHIAHPDMYPEKEDKQHANTAFIKLQEMWTAYQTGGNKQSAAAKIKTKRHEYVLGEQLYSHNGFVTFEITYDAGHEEALVLLPVEAADNDLVENAAEKIRKLNKEAPDDLKAFYPEYVETFKFKINNQIKQLLIYKQHKNLYSLAEVLKEYPEGLDGKDVAWILRRLFATIDSAHRLDVIHGAVNLDTVYIEPDLHGLTLAGWQYATEKGETLVAVPDAYKMDYPSKFLKKNPVDHSLDIVLAAKTLEKILRADAPAQIKAFLKGCQLNNLPSAGKLFLEFDEVIERTYGPKKFHKFVMKTPPKR